MEWRAMWSLAHLMVWLGASRRFLPTLTNLEKWARMAARRQHSDSLGTPLPRKLRIATAIRLILSNLVQHQVVKSVECRQLLWSLWPSIGKEELSRRRHTIFHHLPWILRRRL